MNFFLKPFAFEMHTIVDRKNTKIAIADKQLVCGKKIGYIRTMSEKTFQTLQNYLCASTFVFLQKHKKKP